MSESTGYRRALLGGPDPWERDATRPVPPGGAALHAASPVAYAPEAVLAVLATGTAAAHDVAVWVALPVALVLAVVLVALRQVRRVAGPGGDVALVRAELGPLPAMVAAAALLVDHVLLLSLSVTAAGHLLTGLVPQLRGAETLLVIGLLVLLGAAQLGPRLPRDTVDRISWRALWCFVAALLAVVVVGLVRLASGSLPAAPAAPELLADGSAGRAAGGLAVALVLARAVTAGSVVLAGVTTTGAGPRTGRRRPGNVGRNFLLLAVGAAATLLGLLALAREVGAVPPDVSGQDGNPPVVHQVAVAALGDVVATVAVTVIALSLLLAGAVALRRVPDVRAALLGRDAVPGDAVAPRPVVLASVLGAAVVVTAADASVAVLVPGYVVAVFTLLTLGQVAGSRRWRRAMERHYEPRPRAAARRARLVTAAGAAVTVVVLLLALLSGLGEGSWVAVVVIGAMFAMMWHVSRHRRRIEAELAVAHLPEDRPLPALVRSIVVVTRFDRATMRAVAYARSARSTSLEAVTVPLGEAEAAELRRQWLAADLDVPLVELAAPLGDRGSAVAEYVREIHAADPTCLVAVYAPEVLAGGGLRRLLLGGAERRLRHRLLQLPRTTVTTVPWQIGPGPRHPTQGATSDE
ncbi:hypothetical protein [Georgenia sunbinii]|uniref:hypothetical protein n=1 Tax=Georgenia sunbinii TaxID=3117728 RepID=UPI002F26DEF8